ncbi:MAG TPA: hypothetical protein VF116_03335 [Ktedonobacterales bacterium]
MRFGRRSTGFRLLIVFASLVLVAAGTLSVQVLQTHAAGQSSSGVAPNGLNELDCNGWSTKYRSVRPDMGGLCTDPIAVLNGKATRFLDNGWYVGHDEPSVKFISSASGSGNNMSYFMQLAVDPKAAPTIGPNGTTVSDYAELSPAPWFGLPICDAKSYPQNPCTPDSDSNSGEISNPNDAGSAFMELQFYPPGYTPFIDAPSCDATHYCAALTIDSLECTFGFATCNGACIEPVNFAYLQRDGKPAGPPSPQLTDVDTFTPNNQTLMMNQGDKLLVSIKDTRNGLKTTVVDLTTGQAGFMVASAANGFMNTNIADCTGTPFNFHPEYNTAQQQNQVPWAALEGGVLMQDELGHFEPCSSVTNQLGFTFSNNGQSFSDPQMYQTCNGSFEGPSSTGEGPCSLATFTCQNATTEGGGPCPTDNAATGALCEFSDASCFPAGPRPVTSNGKAETITWPIAGCEDNFFQNGDLDFDGSSYIADWPDGSPNHPSPFRYLGPFDAHGQPYPSIQFETDLAGSESFCNTATGAGCTAPPVGAAFYPFWTLGKHQPFGFGPKVCLWAFGNTIPGETTQSFGGDAQYGTPDVARYGGTLTSPVMANPQFSGGCGR